MRQQIPSLTQKPTASAVLRTNSPLVPIVPGVPFTEVVQQRSAKKSKHDTSGGKNTTLMKIQDTCESMETQLHLHIKKINDIA